MDMGPKTECGVVVIGALEYFDEGIARAGGTEIIAGAGSEFGLDAKVVGGAAGIIGSVAAVNPLLIDRHGAIIEIDRIDEPVETSGIAIQVTQSDHGVGRSGGGIHAAFHHTTPQHLGHGEKKPCRSPTPLPCYDEPF